VSASKLSVAKLIVVIKINKDKNWKKLHESIYLNQKKYKKLRSDAHNELEILEEYFGGNILKGKREQVTKIFSTVTGNPSSYLELLRG
jgi:hypothetical protein